ncbi:adenosine deaminase [Legionella beliardensis]|uniref:Adenosine deaminase n=1 Tax=Legionella beliardensis TaxID=91822 RepID=A0A378I3P8_9GAMM|nr:adenosine deaminase [Legionella beliardensis]STX29817.1 adenosine deaminase [Legionella beliardensis]
MSIKKAELHVHLEGTISPDLAKKLAARNQVFLPEERIDYNKNRYVYSDFLDFLKAYDVVAEVIKSPQDYYDITFDYLKSTAEQGGIYVEMMYSPDHAEQASGIPSSEHLQAIQQAIDDAEEKFNIIGRIIITAVRHFGAESAEKVAKQALKEQVPCLVGFGLGGDEFNFPPKLFQKAYKIAADGGLLCTVHAGEFAPASGMIEAMDYLPIQRIGHGVMAIHSPETIARLKDKNIALEICPTSNIALGLFKDLKSHPLIPLMDAGITVSLNSDDPPFFGTNLGNEYEKVQQLYQFSQEKMHDFTRMAIKAAFLDEAKKKQLLQAIN